MSPINQKQWSETI